MSMLDCYDLISCPVMKMNNENLTHVSIKYFSFKI